MPNNILITPGSASIQFSGSTDNIIRLQVQPLGQVDFISQSVSLVSIGNTGITTTGSITVVNGGVTSSLFGTSSWASNAVTASFFTGSITFPSGLIVTGSVLATTVSASSFIGPLTGTASFATSASFAISSSRSITSSFASTASVATSASWAPAFPYIGIAQITGSVDVVSGSIRVTSGSANYTVRYNAIDAFIYNTNGASHRFTTNDGNGIIFTGDAGEFRPVVNNSIALGGSATRWSNTFTNNLLASGSIIHTGSLNMVSGSINVTNGGITSSLFGTSSWAVSSSRATTATTALTASFFDGFITFPAGLDITGSLIVTGSQAITGSLNVTGGITGSVLGSSSFATTSSFAVSASWAPSAPGGGITSLTAGDGLTGGTITSTGTITVDTGSAHFLDGVKKELNTEGVVSSSAQISYSGITNVPSGIISSSTFSSPSQGTVRAVINGTQTDVDTGLQTGDSPQFTNLNISSTITASIISASTAITASNVRLNGLTDITSTNKVLVLDTATNKIFTTASVGVGGGSTPAFPYDGRTTPAVISGSLFISASSANAPALLLTGSISMSNGGALFRSNTTLTRIQGNIISTDGNTAGITIRYAPLDNGVKFDVDSTMFPETDNLGRIGTPTQRWNSAIITNISASVVSSSIITGSHVQLVNVVDTTSTNKVLVLDTVTNKIFTTASVGGGGGSGNGFPYNGTVTPAIISGSLLISSSINSPLTVSGSVDSFFELEVVNASAGNNASADIVVSPDNTTDFGNYASFGINSTTYNAGLVGGASDAYLYVTSSVGELDIGHAHTGANSNIRLFTNGPNSTANTRVFVSSSGNVGIGTTTNLVNRLTVSGNILATGITGSFTGSLTGSVFGTASNAITASFVLGSGLPSGLVSSSTQINTGSFTGNITNLTEMSLLVSGGITASGTIGLNLDLNGSNYFAITSSGTGTVTWTISNPAPLNRMQTFIIEYAGGGQKTNTWFTNTRWPAGTAPTLTSNGVDLLSFTSDDSGANWRGVLLQRDSR